MTYKMTLRGVTEAPREYACTAHGPFELVVDLATSSAPRPCPECAAPSERTLESRIITRMAGGFKRGKRDEMPAWATTTEAIADGMPVAEWKEKRAKFWEDHDRKVSRAKGLIP